MDGGAVEREEKAGAQEPAAQGGVSGVRDAENGRVFYMWEPLKFQTKPGYDYLRNGLFQRLGSGLLRTVADAILALFDRAAFGMKIEGRENLSALGKRGAVVVCNHVHPMDCTMVDLALFDRRMYYMTLEFNFRIPLVRHLVRWLGGVPLSPDRRCMKELFDAMGQAIDAGACVQIYPEGVLRPYEKTLHPFKHGAFRLAASCGAPVVPAVVVQRKPRGLYRLYKKKPCLTIRLLPPVFPEEGAVARQDALRMAAVCREAMERELSSER